MDELNPTGLPQVVEERTGGAVQRSYAYGLQRITEDRVVAGAIVPSFYSYDGHGEVRLLTDSTGADDDPGSPHPYLYAGANPVDQSDPTGRFFESAIALQVVTRVAANLIPSASISNNFTSGAFTFVGRQFICIMSEVASQLRIAVACSISATVRPTRILRVAEERVGEAAVVAAAVQTGT